MSQEFDATSDLGGEGVLSIGGGAVGFRGTTGEWNTRVRDLEGLKVARKSSKLRVSVVDVGKRVVVTLQFASSAVRDAAAGAISSNRAMEVREQEIPHSAAPPLDPESSRRAAALSSDPSLRRLHRKVVVERGWVAEDEFWTRHRTAKDDEKGRNPGMRSAHFTRELLASASGGEGQGNVYRVGSQLVNDVFSEHPQVAAAYRTHVLQRDMPEAEFWSQFLSSPFFRSRGAERGAGRAEHRNIFDRLWTEVEEEKKEEGTGDPRKHPVLEPSLSTTGTVGYGTRKPEEWVGCDHNMEVAEDGGGGSAAGRRFNKHSEAVLKSVGAAGVEEEAAGEGQDEPLPQQPSTFRPRKRGRSAATCAPLRSPLKPVPLQRFPASFKLPDKAAASTSVSASVFGCHGEKAGQWLSQAGKGVELTSAVGPPASDPVAEELLAHFWKATTTSPSEGRRLLGCVVKYKDELGETAVELKQKLMHESDPVQRAALDADIRSARYLQKLLGAAQYYVTGEEKVDGWKAV